MVVDNDTRGWIMSCVSGVGKFESSDNRLFVIMTFSQPFKLALLAQV